MSGPPESIVEPGPVRTIPPSSSEDGKARAVRLSDGGRGLVRSRRNK